MPSTADRTNWVNRIDLHERCEARAQAHEILRKRKIRLEKSRYQTDYSLRKTTSAVDKYHSDNHALHADLVSYRDSLDVIPTDWRRLLNRAIKTIERHQSEFVPEVRELLAQAIPIKQQKRKRKRKRQTTTFYEPETITYPDPEPMTMKGRIGRLRQQRQSIDTTIKTLRKNKDSLPLDSLAALVTKLRGYESHVILYHKALRSTDSPYTAHLKAERDWATDQLGKPWVEAVDEYEDCLRRAEEDKQRRFEANQWKDI